MRVLLAVTVTFALSVALLSTPQLALADTWNDVGTTGSQGIYSMAWAGTNLYAGSTTGNVFRYDGGTTWTNVGDFGAGLNTQLVWNGTDLFAYAGDGHMYRHNGGDSWSDTGGALAGGTGKLCWTGTYVYLTCDNGNAYRYDGSNWSGVGSPGGTASSGVAWTGSSLFAAFRNGGVYLYKGGTTWESWGAPDGTTPRSIVWNGSNIYLGCRNGHVYRCDGKSVWTDTGNTCGNWVNDLLWDGNDIYAACEDGNVYRYSAGAWATTSGPGTSFDALESLAWTGGNVYTGSKNGSVFRDGDLVTPTTITSLSRDDGSAGIPVDINGTTFGATMGNSQVFFGATPCAATDYESWSDTDIRVLVPAGAPKGTCSITVVRGGCISNGKKFTVKDPVPPPPPTLTSTPPDSKGNFTVYGQTGYDSSPVNIFVNYNNGGWHRHGTVTAGPGLGFYQYKFTKMKAGTYRIYSNYWGLVGSVMTLSRPSSTVTVQVNPSITSISPSSGPPGTEVAITGSGFGGSRGSGGSAAGASYVSFNGTRATGYSKWTDTKIVCTVPDGASTGPVKVVVNGASSNKSAFTVCSPAWYLAEGTTAYGFSTYITIQNPNTSAVSCRVTYMTGSGPKAIPEVTLPASSQLTINPQSELGDMDFSTKVECTDSKKTIAVDRTMTWTGTGAKSPEAHASVGVPSPAKAWYLPEGSCQWGFETWLLIQNPNEGEATCTVTYMTEGKGPKAVQHRVPGKSRMTCSMIEDLGFPADASIKVESDIPVIPERAMYRNSRREGHDSIGTTAPAQDYYLAEGATGYDVGYVTYVLVQNPQGSPTDVTITYLTGTGQVAGPSFQMEPNSRKTVRLNDQLPPNMDVSTKVHGSAPIIAERAMYWDNGTGEACHDSIGMSMPHTTFFLPDGETSNGRETWTLVQNPNSEEVEVEISYLTPSGKDNVTFGDKIPANSRKTYPMAERLSGGRASVMVRSKDPARKIMVERSMYWNDRGAGTDTIGGYSD